MSILQKDFDVTVTQGSYGTPGTPGVPAQDGYWTVTQTVTQSYSQYVKPSADVDSDVTAVNTTTARFASHAELRLIWPSLTTNCAMMKRILYVIRATPRGGAPLHWIDNVRYIAVAQIAYTGRGGVSLCVVTGPVVLFTNPEYRAGYVYHGEISGCP